MRFSTMALALALPLVVACNSGTQSTPADTTQPQTPPVEITASCGGGVTGGSEGITITPDDHVLSWEKATAGAQRTQDDLGAGPAFAADVRRQLDMIGFANIQYDETGNMTCSLIVGDHRVSWSQGDANAPVRAVDVFELVYTADGREQE